MVATPNIHPPSGGPKPPPKSFNPKKDSPMAGGSVDGINSKQKSKNAGNSFKATHPDGSEGGSFNAESAKKLFGGNKNQNNQGQSQGQTQPQQAQKNGRLQTAHGAHKTEGGSKFDRLKSTLQDAAQQAKSGDIRKGAAVVADEYLGLGEKVGDLLFYVWLSITVSMSIVGFIVGGIIPLIILNMLLFSPKTVYRITEIILDLIPTGVTQAIAAFAEEVGLDNLKITIRGFEKAIIILVDLIILAIVGIIITVLVYSFCSLVLPSSFTDKVKVFVSDPVKGATQAAAGFVLPKEIVDFCQSQFGGGGDFGGGGASDSFGGGITGSGGTVGSGGSCSRCTSGTGSVEFFQGTCMAANAEVASYVAAAESSCGSNNVSGSDICADGNPVSFGLFQINISAHRVGGLNCPNAFSNGPYEAGNKNCRVADSDLYNKCKAAALDLETNINFACKILGDKKASNSRYWYPTWGGASCLHKNGNQDVIN